MKNTDMLTYRCHCSDDIKLRCLTIDDFAIVLKWSRDASFCSANGWAPYRSSEELYNWWLRCIQNDAENFVRLGIMYEDALIGYADLADLHEHTAEIGIAIGNSELWGKGLGYLASMCMIQYGAEELGIRVFYAETDDSNVRSQKMLEKIGFRKIDRAPTEKCIHSKQPPLQYQLHLQNKR